MRQWKCWVVPAVDLVVLAGFVLYISRPPGPSYADPNPASTFKIAALGDSYISGEGAREFFAGTDDPGRNSCRRAPTAYSYLAAVELGASLEFFACSGATTEDVLKRGQQPLRNPAIPGGEEQIENLRPVAAETDVVLISIGGNDAGFGAIGQGCTIGGDCRRNADYWLTTLDEVVYPALTMTFRTVQEVAPEAEVFVMTYPDPLGPRHCALPLSFAEQAFLKEEFIPRLNDLIRFAAAVESVRVIELSDVLVGHRICEVPVGQAAANILGLSRTRGQRIHLVELPHGTFHPNELGHRLIARVVVDTLRELREGKLPPLGEPPPPGITPPPHVPSEIGAPVGPYVFPEGTRCVGERLLG